MAISLQQLMLQAQYPQMYAQLEAVRQKAYYAAELEGMRAQNEMHLEAVRAEANYRQGQIDHQNRLAEMERELEHKIEFAGVQSMLKNSDELGALNRKVIEGALEGIATRTATRAEIFKNVMAIVAQEKQAKAAHKRAMELEEMRHRHDMEKLGEQSNEQRASAYFDKLCAYVFAMMQAGREAEASADVRDIFARAESQGL